MSKHRKLKLEELGRISVDDFKNKKKISCVIVLDNIRSHHNVGSVFRTADAFLVEAIYLCGYTPCPPHREIHKTALGATESVSWTYFESTQAAVNKLKDDSYSVFAIEQTLDSIPLNKAELKQDKIAFVFGNEVDGVDQSVIDSCTNVIEIPQSGTKHSINISVCAGIIMWEIYSMHNI